MDDLVFCTATELAKLIREKSASAQEVLDAHLRHIAEHNPSLNAIVTSNEEKARQRAEQADVAPRLGEVPGCASSFAGNQVIPSPRGDLLVSRGCHPQPRLRVPPQCGHRR